MDQESVGVYITCRVRKCQEVLHLTGESRVKFCGWVFGFM